MLDGGEKDLVHKENLLAVDLGQEVRELDPGHARLVQLGRHTRHSQLQGVLSVVNIQRNLVRHGQVQNGGGPVRFLAGFAIG